MKVAALLLSVALVGGCAGTYHGTVAVTSASPDLVYVAPGVQVIADYDEPILFVDGAYWWMLDGIWYRSPYYTGGWVAVTAPPLAIVRLGPLHVYRHYRPAGWVARHHPVPAHRVQRPIARDHRSERARVHDHRR